MLKVEYKCSNCKTVYIIEWNDHSPITMKWIDKIDKDTDTGLNMMNTKESWFIPRVCSVCKAKFMKYYKDTGWNYDSGLEYIKYDYSKCNSKYENWFSNLNG